MQEEAQVSLQAMTRDAVGLARGQAWLAPELRAALGCEPGDAITIQGTRTTVATLAADAPEGYAADGEPAIALEPLARLNAGAALHEMVTLSRAQVVPAISIALAPHGKAQALSEVELRHVARALRDFALVAGDTIRVPGLGLSAHEFHVLATNPACPVVCGPGTVLRIQPPGGGVAPAGDQITYAAIGGLDRELQRVRELIELPLKHPELFERLGIEAPKGVLLHGPPGTGKTLIARAVASASGAKFFSIGGPEIIDKWYGESEAHLRRIFEQAQRQSPSVIFIDEIDAIAPKRADVYGEVEKRVVTQLLSLLDGIAARGQVIVIGATNRPDALDPALRRPGRFDREIALHAPDAKGRQEILRIHSLDMPLDAAVDLAEIARLTPGFVGADLTALCREAALTALRRVAPNAERIQGSIQLETLLDLTVTMPDFRSALRGLEPSATREVAVEMSHTAWEDIGGLEEAKRLLVETVEWPLRYPDIYAMLAVSPARGVLLSGPPGTGKTLIARAVAAACQANFIAIKGPELLSRWVGESERGVREAFARARQVAPCILFLDEFDALAPSRGNHFDGVSDRVIGQLLTELDGVASRDGVIVIAATNRPELIDPALLRPGRFDLLLDLPLPDRAARAAIFAIHLRDRPLDSGVKPDALARKTNGLSGADIEAICRRAANLALAEWLRAMKGQPQEPRPDAAPQITSAHLDDALRDITSQRSPARPAWQW